jgi:hypothetical protein
MVPEGPLFRPNAQVICPVIKLLDLAKDDLFLRFGLLSPIRTPPAEILSEANTHEIPPVDNITPTHPLG